jgi:hypothetical protein
MGQPKSPKSAKLIAGLLAPNEAALSVAIERLAAEFGPLDLRSEVWDFTATQYYRAELGAHIKRQFVSFADPIAIERLPEIKRRTNELEWLSADGQPSAQRVINIDPGYLTLSKLVLATTKDYAHRLYLRDGIYAEVTLHYESGAWRPWPWTYRDYASGQYSEFFERVRELLKKQLSAANQDSPPRSEPRA